MMKWGTSDGDVALRLVSGSQRRVAVCLSGCGQAEHHRRFDIRKTIQILQY